MGKIQDRAQEVRKLSQLAVKVSWKQMLFDLIASGILSEQLDQQHTVKSLKS